MRYTTTLSHSCVLRKLSVNTAAFTEREFCIEHETYLQLKSNSLQQLSHPRFRHILGKGEGGVTLIIYTQYGKGNYCFAPIFYPKASVNNVN